MGQGTLGDVLDGSETLREVRDRSGDPQLGQGRIGVQSQRPGSGRGTLG